MAKKKIESKKKVDAGGAQSKTARASMAKGRKPEGFIASGEMDRFISLNHGEHVYFLDPRDGKTHHLEVSSVKYQTVLTEVLASTHGDRIRAEMERKGFPLPVVAGPVSSGQFLNTESVNPCLDIPTGELGPGEFRSVANAH